MRIGVIIFYDVCKQFSEAKAENCYWTEYAYKEADIDSFWEGLSPLLDLRHLQCENEFRHDASLFCQNNDISRA